VGLDVGAMSILSLLCFCLGWTNIAGLLFVNLYFYFFIGQRFRAGRSMNSPPAAIPVRYLQAYSATVLIMGRQNTANVCNSDLPRNSKNYYRKYINRTN
jgi:hypothetical protein